MTEQQQQIILALYGNGGLAERLDAYSPKEANAQINAIRDSWPAMLEHVLGTCRLSSALMAQLQSLYPFMTAAGDFVATMMPLVNQAMIDDLGRSDDSDDQGFRQALAQGLARYSVAKLWQPTGTAFSGGRRHSLSAFNSTNLPPVPPSITKKEQAFQGRRATFASEGLDSLVRAEDTLVSSASMPNMLDPKLQKISLARLFGQVDDQEDDVSSMGHTTGTNSTASMITINSGKDNVPRRFSVRGWRDSIVAQRTEDPNEMVDTFTPDIESTELLPQDANRSPKVSIDTHFSAMAAHLDHYYAQMLEGGYDAYSQAAVQISIAGIKARVAQIAMANMEAMGDIEAAERMKNRTIQNCDAIFKAPTDHPNPLLAAQAFQRFMHNLAVRSLLQRSMNNLAVESVDDSTDYLAQRKNAYEAWQASMVSTWGGWAPPAVSLLEDTDEHDGVILNLRPLGELMQGSTSPVEMPVSEDVEGDEREKELLEEQRPEKDVFDALLASPVPAKFYMRSLQYLFELKGKLEQKPDLDLTQYLSYIQQMFEFIQQPHALDDIIGHYQSEGSVDDDHLEQLKQMLIEVPLLLYEYAGQAEEQHEKEKSLALMQYAVSLLMPLTKEKNQKLLVDFFEEDDSFKEQLTAVVAFMKNGDVERFRLTTLCLFTSYRDKHFPAPKAAILRLPLDSSFFENILAAIKDFKEADRSTWSEDETESFIIEQLKAIKAMVPAALAGPVDFMLAQDYSLTLTTQMLDSWFISLPQLIVACNTEEPPTLQFTDDAEGTLSKEQVLDMFVQATKTVVWPQAHAALASRVIEGSPKAEAYRDWCSANDGFIAFAMIKAQLYGDNADRQTAFNRLRDLLSQRLDHEQLTALDIFFINTGSKASFYYDLSLHLCAILPSDDATAAHFFKVHMLSQAVRTYQQQMAASHEPLEPTERIQRGLDVLRMLTDLLSQDQGLAGTVGGFDEALATLKAMLADIWQDFGVSDASYCEQWQQALAASDIHTLKGLFLCLPIMVPSTKRCPHSSFLLMLSMDKQPDPFLPNEALTAVLNRPASSMAMVRALSQDYEAVVTQLAASLGIAAKTPAPEPTVSQPVAPSQTELCLTGFHQIQDCIFDEQGLLAQWLSTPLGTKIKVKEWLPFISTALASSGIKDDLVLSFDVKTLLLDCVKAGFQMDSLSTTVESMQTQLLDLLVNYYKVPAEAPGLSEVRQAIPQKTQAWAEDNQAILAARVPVSSAVVVKGHDKAVSSVHEVESLNKIQKTAGWVLAVQRWKWRSQLSEKAKTMEAGLKDSVVGKMSRVTVTDNAAVMLKTEHATVTSTMRPGQAAENDLFGVSAAMHVSLADTKSEKRAQIIQACRSLAQTSALAFYTSSTSSAAKGEDIFSKPLDIQAQSSNGQTISSIDRLYAKCLKKALLELGFTVHLHEVKSLSPPPVLHQSSLHSEDVRHAVDPLTPIPTLNPNAQASNHLVVE